MDEQPGARDVDDFLQAPVLGTEDTMAIDRRQKKDREPAALVRLNVDVRNQGSQGILDPFHGHQSTLFHAADILDRAVEGLRISGVPAGMGRHSGFTPRVNTALKDR